MQTEMSKEVEEYSIDDKLSVLVSSPFVLCGALQNWPASKWTLASLAEILGHKLFPCRLMPRERCGAAGPAWESEGVYINCSIKDFLNWCEGDAKENNPLYPFSPWEFSGYIDYKYMTSVFEQCEYMLDEVCWSTLGLCGLDGHNSTMWIGSTEASTPCHFDSYGFNLVAQIQGRKTWVLFPPQDTPCLYPTRIPYEESSIFSEVDVSRPNTTNFPRFKDCKPYVVTLEPGQVLYVPRHWWHFVVCTEMALSINTWLEMPEDTESRIHEAVTRCLASCLIPYCSQTASKSILDQWVNPTEDLEPVSTNMAYLQAALNHSKDSSEASRCNMTGSHEYGGSDNPDGCLQGLSKSIEENTSVTFSVFRDMPGKQSLTSACGCKAITKGSSDITGSFSIRLQQLAKYLKDSTFSFVKTPFMWSKFIRQASSLAPSQLSTEALQRTEENISLNNTTGKLYEMDDINNSENFQPRKKLKIQEISRSSATGLLEQREELYDEERESAQCHIPSVQVFALEACSFEEYLDAVNKVCPRSSSTVEQTRALDVPSSRTGKSNLEEILLKSVLHSDVVELIVKKLKENSLSF
ncbi:HSPB1-associated protein 1 homolog isoform X3 [Pomacea canaliculata]|nr:HSPB1-associated protein 1 homolog isoform X3 [Pomacea canaliculata]